MENGPCAHKKERTASPIPPSPSPLGARLYGPRRSGNLPAKTSQQLEPGAQSGSSKGLALCPPNSHFLPDWGKFPAQRELSALPGRGGLGPILAVEGPIGLSPPQLLWGREASPGGRTKQGVRGGAQAVSWVATPGGVSWNPPSSLGQPALCPRGAPRWRVKNPTLVDHGGLC